MKKLYTVLFVFIFINQIYAENVEGYYISKNNDTVKVLFKIPIYLITQKPNFYKLLEKVEYIDSNNKKRVLNQNQTSEFVFVYHNENIRLISVFIDENYFFLQLIKDGKLRLLKYFQHEAQRGSYNHSTGMREGGYSYDVGVYVMQRDGEVLETSEETFRTDMIGYLHDCREISKKVYEKTLGFRDFEQIVDEYNSKCYK